MKKQLLKLTLLAVVVFFSASTVNAQTKEEVEWHKNGYYTIGIPGQNLFMTIDSSTGNLIWAEALTGDNIVLQQWAITDHITPSSAGLMQITAEVPGVGTFTMATAAVGDPVARDLTLIARPGGPVAVPTTLVDDYSGLDQFQRRRASTHFGGNNALFLRTPADTGSRFGVIPTAAGEPVQFDGGGIDILEFVIQDRELPATASANTFGVDALSISNPVNNQLTIKGATSKVQELSLYSVLGNKVLSKTVKNVNGNINLDVNSLSTGLYILKVVGVNGERLSKKIIKQ